MVERRTVGKHARERQAAEARHQPHDPAEGSGGAHRAAGIGPAGKVDEARGHGHGRARGGAARDALGVVRICGRAGDRGTVRSCPRRAGASRACQARRPRRRGRARPRRRRPLPRPGRTRVPVELARGHWGRQRSWAGRRHRSSPSRRPGPPRGRRGRLAPRRPGPRPRPAPGRAPRKAARKRRDPRAQRPGPASARTRPARSAHRRGLRAASATAPAGSRAQRPDGVRHARTSAGARSRSRRARSRPARCGRS